MEQFTVGIIKETKTPPDKRVPLTPEQCVQVMKQWPNVKISVQSSDIRAFKDQDYRDLGIEVTDNVSHCEVLMGVKEVKIDALVPNRKYFFFSHTFKKQPYNRDLLQAIIDKKIQLIDYETLTDKNNQRIIGFGRFAGIVGCYNGLLALGKKFGLYDLKPANKCFDRKEVDQELQKVVLPPTFKIVLTGFGRVGNGAREIMSTIGIKEVSPQSFLNDKFDEAVFTHLKVQDYYAREDGAPFDKAAFFNSGEGHISTFGRYTKKAEMYVACHYWDDSSPFILTREHLAAPDNALKIVADVSCDIDGPIASTLRPSTIADPLYGYNPHTGQETEFLNEDAIGVMAVDNLPCELPRDASESFGNDLINEVFPALFGPDPDKIIERASETNLEGKLMPKFAYLESYLAGE